MPKPLTIGVDIRDLKVAKTGTKTYLEELCKAFRKMNNEELRFHFFDSLISPYTGDNKIFKWVEHARYQLWKQLSLPLKAVFKGCDIVFCTDNFVPLIHLGYKTIPVFHDAFFFETPENYGKLWLWLYRKTAVPAAKRSPFVITPSNYAKSRINHYTNIPKEKLMVIYEGPKLFLNAENDVFAPAILQSFSLKPQNYILHAGSMFKRKNIPALITAFGQLKSKGYAEMKLVLAGPKPAATENDYQTIVAAIKSYNLQNEVVLTGYLTDQELGVLYQNALFYVFPSINEGFGIPVLEAFKNNIPVLVADNTCLPEIGGDAVLQFDPFDTNAIFIAIKTVLDNEELRKEMIRKGQERLEDFSWEKTASQIVAIFEKAAEV
jgi:glycosyltransferase involved in cell wall biosynthesis